MGSTGAISDCEGVGIGEAVSEGLGVGVGVGSGDGVGSRVGVGSGVGVIVGSGVGVGVGSTGHVEFHIITDPSQQVISGGVGGH